MNYRHHYHAGNFADLVKHAALLAILSRLTAGPEPLTVVDTHAGAGLYDLEGEMARRSGEAEAGVVRLLADSAAPAVFAPLKAAIARVNPAGALRFYPGSPLLAAGALRRGDSLTAFELRPDDARALGEALKPLAARTEVVCADGFEAAPARMPAKGPALALIDPPFERADDYVRITTGLGRILGRNAYATVAVWAPLKDLETFDRLLRGIEATLAAPTLVIETRLRPLDDPLRLNGCALIVTNPPPGLEADLAAASDWTVRNLGGPAGESRVWRL